MTIDKVKQKIESLRELIRGADYRYYALSDPDISDKEYDNLFEKLKKLENENPKLITDDSPTQRIFDGLLEEFSTVKHRGKMLSLDNTYSIEELNKWEERIKKNIKNDVSLDYFVELKMDGISASLIYDNFKLVIGATRGNGDTGENITANVRTIKSIPLRLRGEDIPNLIEVRGEVYIDKNDFESLNKKRVSVGDNLFANPRNAASGSLKLLDPNLVDKRKLKYFVHSFGYVENYKIHTQKDFFEKAKEWGLAINKNNKYCKNIKEVIAYCLYWQEKRDTLSYEVDGVVVKVNSFGLQKKIGTTAKSPRWAVAYKFLARQATTRVEKIELSVGRTGVITPVAHLEPVECGGVTISRSTLHNFDEIERLGIREGDVVLIERAGDVIPKIVKVIDSKRNGRERIFIRPKVCPVCDEKTAKDKVERKSGESGEYSSGVFLYCMNPDCPAQLKRALGHFVSRSALDIEGMGKSVINELVDKGYVSSLVDIYTLKKEDLFKLNLFKEKKVNNLILAIERSKNNPLASFLYGLGIKHVGEKAALILAETFRTIDNFYTLKMSDLEMISDIGPILAGSIVDFFSTAKIRKMIEKFKLFGVNLVQEKKIVESTRILGKVFVFTGELENLTRDDAKKIVIEQGGKFSSSVGKNTDFLVLGKNSGSKYKKAKELGIKTISEKDFLEMSGKL
ncbi:MAG: NAD-dependent DNA ligase LigA [Candidatus Omnitrophica bacterium]|nr:NAD-dependent DNA ligase LigA [Candidatus Omnitrophota bacterium]